MSDSSFRPEQIAAAGSTATAAMRPGVAVPHGTVPGTQAVNRRPIGLSSAGHCRAEIWLSAHGFPAEEPLPNVQRKFDMGHLIEAAVFDRVPIPGGSADDGSIGPWFKALGTITDYSTGQTYNTTAIEVQDRQDEVEIDGFKGHLDGIGGPEPFRVMDSKSMPSYSYVRNIKEDLTANVFTREMVVQQQMYIHGTREKRPSLAPDEAMLVFVNRDDLSMSCRIVEFDPAMVEEGRERLSWAKSKAEPKPDYEWTRGQPIPLRCSYCSFREACGEVRGIPIKLSITKGKPTWTAQ